LRRANYTALAINAETPNCTENVVYWGGRTGDLDTYSCTYDTFNISAYAEIDFPEILPRTSYTHTCTGNSFVAKSMTLASFSAGSDGSVAVRIENPSPGDHYGFVLDKVQKDGAWHKCEGSGGLPWQLESCDYRVDGEEVGFKLVWLCDDIDPFHA
jgi:hypothetical protein